MQKAPKERTMTSVTASILKEEADFFKDDSVSNKGILFSLFSKITADVDFLKPNLMYRFFYSVTENENGSTHILYMEKLDGVTRTKEHKELLYGSKYRSTELFSFRPNLIEFLIERALNQMSNKELNTLLFKERIYLVSEWLKNTQTDSFVITTENVRQQEQPLEISIYGFYGPTKYL